MGNNRIGLGLMLLPVLGWAQQSLPTGTQPAYDALKAAEQKQISVAYTPASVPFVMEAGIQSITEYYQRTEPVLSLPGMGLQLVSDKQSRMGRHLMYAQTYQGIPVIGAWFKVNIDVHGNVLSVFNSLQSFSGNIEIPAEQKHLQILLVNEQPQLVYAYHEGESYFVKELNGTIIRERDAKLYMMQDDTTAQGKVFRPDPVTPINVISGQNNTYKNYNDSDYAMLNNQRVDVSFPVTYDNGMFYLKNNFVEVLDFLSPNIAPPVLSTPTFNYLRGDDAFEDVMVLYHITHLQQQLHAIGINQVNVPIKCDAHASTQDNSSFLPADTTLRFGTGGVQDAEDADVIVHEFTHALSFFISPTVSMSNERRAMDEAMGDIQAAIYSKRVASFNWRKIFNWDAPNPVAAGTTAFWSGRNAASTKTYDDYTNNPYSDCEIWSSTILDIAESVGHDTTLVLLFSSLASYTDQTTMPQAAELFMQADSVLMNKAYGWKIGPIFNARGLGNFPTAVPEVERLMHRLSIANSAEFAMGTGIAVLELPFDAVVNVYDIQGRLVENRNVKAGNIQFDPNQYMPGMYVIRISAQGLEAVIKLVR